jgi:hypothetical protein
MIVNGGGGYPEVAAISRGSFLPMQISELQRTNGKVTMSSLTHRIP